MMCRKVHTMVGLALLSAAMTLAGGCCRCGDKGEKKAQAKEQFAAEEAKSFGITVVGKFRLDGGLTPLRADQVRVRIYPPAPPMPFQGDFRDDPMWRQYQANLETPEGQRRSQRVTVWEDGSFQIPNVPTGEFWVQSYVPAELRDDGVNNSITLKTEKFSVPLFGGQLDLGEL